MHTAARHSTWLTAAMAATLLVLLIPACALYQTVGALSVLSAVGLCLAVGCAVFVVVERLSQQGQEIFAVLIGMGLRMFLVLGAALAVSFWQPNLREAGFLWWLAIAYLVSLFVETRLLLAVSGTNPANGNTIVG